MFRKISFLVLITVSVLIGACAPAASVTPTAVLSPTIAPTAVPTFPMTIVDGLGHKMTIAAAPARIISLAPSNTEILFAVGAGNLVVGVTKYCDYPVEAQQLPQIGGFSAKSISIETIVALKPDLVLANSSGQDSVITALEQAHIKVIAVKAASFEDVYANLQMVGAITGHAAEATAVVDEMKARVAAITEKIAAIPQNQPPTVFWEVFDEPLMTAGPGTFVSQMIVIAGGVNLFADLSEDYPQVSAEEIIKRNPAFILGPDSHGDKLIAEQLATRPGWDQIDAVKNGRVFLVDGNTSSRSGPRLVDALESIAKVLYPNVFK